MPKIKIPTVHIRKTREDGKIIDRPDFPKKLWDRMGAAKKDWSLISEGDVKPVEKKESVRKADNLIQKGDLKGAKKVLEESKKEGASAQVSAKLNEVNDKIEKKG